MQNIIGIPQSTSLSEDADDIDKKKLIKSGKKLKNANSEDERKERKMQKYATGLAPQDKKIRRLERNRQSARDSRKKKKAYIMSLERDVFPLYYKILSHIG